MGETSGTTSTFTILESSALNCDVRRGVVHCSGKVVSRRATLAPSSPQWRSFQLSAGIPVSLSKQQFADFDTTDVGCNEGFMDYTSMFAERNVSSGLKHWRIHEQCGSCWTPTTTCFESVWSIATGNLLTLSEQQLVDCITVDSGCNGTLTINGFIFAAKNAICTEAYLQTARRL